MLALSHNVHRFEFICVEFIEVKNRQSASVADIILDARCNVLGHYDDPQCKQRLAPC